MAKKDGNTSIMTDVDVNVDELLDSASDDALKEEYRNRFSDPLPYDLDDVVADLRKAFADQDKMHFDVLIDRMLQDAGCA